MKPPTLAPVYAVVFGPLSEVARKNGYALAIHGSVTRDCDLVAVPWTEEAIDAETLIERMREAIGWLIIEDGTPAARYDQDACRWVEAAVENPTRKPHGRLAWNFHCDGGAVLDVSVMPRQD